MRCCSTTLPRGAARDSARALYCWPCPTQPHSGCTHETQPREVAEEASVKAVPLNDVLFGKPLKQQAITDRLDGPAGTCGHAKVRACAAPGGQAVLRDSVCHACVRAKNQSKPLRLSRACHKSCGEDKRRLRRELASIAKSTTANNKLTLNTILDPRTVVCNICGQVAITVSIAHARHCAPEGHG